MNTPTILDSLHLMVDIETLSTEHNAFVTELSAVLFRPYVELNAPYEQLDSLTLVMDPWREQKGSHISTDTMVWRQRQPEEHKSKLRERPAEYTPFDKALLALEDFIKEHKPAKVWANSPNFDLTILNNAMKREHGRELFKYYDQMDVRTIIGLVRIENPDFKLHNDHSALSDCGNQIKAVQDFFRSRYGTTNK